VVTVEYRMASVALAPAAVGDCHCALCWVYQHANDYGFETTKLVVEGSSAGGHLALITGMLTPDAGFDGDCPGTENLKVAAIVNYFGITDVADALEGPNRKNYTVMWLNSLPDRMNLAKRLSPLTYVRAGLPPVITLQGDKDPTVPYPQGVRLHDALDRAGVPNQLVTIPGGGHGGWSLEENLRGQQAVFQFLHEHKIP
jgi:acetyl esterase/lipase